MRCPVEVAFEEARAPLDFEIQRQWSDQTIARPPRLCWRCSL
jgi:hypothetical protein